MSQRVQSVVGWILALAIFAAAIYAVVRGVEKDPTIVGSFVTAAGAVAAVVWGRTREKKLELLQSHRAEMRPVYEELLTAFSTTTPDAGFMQEFQRKILVLGATSVLQAWLAFVRAQPPDGEPANLAFMLLQEQVLFAIRADLGHDNTGLAPGDLLRVYVNDADTFFRESKTDLTPPSS